MSRPPIILGIIDGFVLSEKATRVPIRNENASVSTGLDLRGSDLAGLDPLRRAIAVQEPDAATSRIVFDDSLYIVHVYMWVLEPSASKTRDAED